MNRQEIIKQYDSFPKGKQDMSKAEFIRQVEDMQDPVKVQQDVMQIIHGRRQQRVIDNAVRNNNGN